MGPVFARVASYWRALRRPERLWAEMDEEMRFHVAMEAERLERERGLAPREARRQAALAFGGVEQYRERGREVRGFNWVSGFSLDVKLAWRMLVKSRGLTIVGVLGIALGVAVGVAFFVVLSTFVYPKLPLEDGHRIVGLENWDVDANNESRRSLHDFLTWREELRSVVQVGAFSLVERTLIDGEATPQVVRAAEMTAAGFQVARVPPLLGRPVVVADEREGAQPVAVIGYDLWQARFAGDPQVIGRPVIVGDREHIIVGVMPADFAFPKNQELWTALQPNAARHARGQGPELFVFGRLAPGVTRAQAQAELEAIGTRAAIEYPATNARLRPQVLPYTHPLDDVQGMKLWDVARFQLMVSLLLVAIAVNMAVLVYARTATRQAEIALRTALGASRARVVGQLFVEALALSLCGAALGLLIAHLVLAQAKRVMQGMGALGFWVDYGLQPRSVAFAVVMAVLSAMIVGVLPGLSSTGRRLTAYLGRLGTGGSARLGRTWTLLIVAQVAIAVAVLPAAVNVGLEQMRVVAWRPAYPAHEYLEARVGVAVPLRRGMDAEAYRRESAARFGARLPELERRLESSPSVVAVTFEGRIPGRGPLLEVEGVPGSETGAHWVIHTGVATDYFDVFGIRTLAGRTLRSADTGPGGTGLVVSEAFVREVLRGQSAIGRKVRFVRQEPAPGGGEQLVGDAWQEIVGVVEDLQVSALDPEKSSPAVYYAVSPAELQSASLLVHVRGEDASAFAPKLRREIMTLDRDLRIAAVNNLATLRNAPILMTMVLVVLLVLGTVTLLSAAGIHALMSLTVTRRRREIGIRTALGARPGRLLAGIFSRAAWQLGIGGVVGTGLGAALLSQSSVQPAEAAAIVAGVLALMLAAGLVATVGPARRGLRVQPLDALREE